MNYREKLKDYTDRYYTPRVYHDLSTKHVLCSEFIDGKEIDTFMNDT